MANKCMFTNQQEADFYLNRALIPPPSVQTAESDRNKLVRVFLDSRWRDVERWPLSSEFAIPLDTPIEWVVSARLTNYKISPVSYLISNANNTFLYSESIVTFAPDGRLVTPGNAKTVVVPTGNYDGPQLATRLQALMNVESQGTINVAFDATTEKFTFSSDLQPKTGGDVLGLSLIFHSPTSCAKVLGFEDEGVYVGASPMPITAYAGTTAVLMNTAAVIPLAVGDAVTLGDGTAAAMKASVGYVNGAFVQLTAPLAANIINGSINNGRIVSPYKFLNYAQASNDYVLLEIENFGSGILPDTLPPGRAFAVLTTTPHLRPHADVAYERFFRPPIASMKHFKLTFKNWDGQVCDFGNQEVFVELQLMISKNKRQFV